MATDAEVVVRKGYEPEDLEQIYTVEKFCFLDRAWELHKLERELAHTYTVWTAKADGKIVGYLAVRILRKKPDIIALAVIKKYRRLGVASRLMRMAESECRKKFKKITLIVNIHNPAQILYFKRGYRAAKVYTDGTMRMTKLF